MIERVGRIDNVNRLGCSDVALQAVSAKGQRCSCLPSPVQLFSERDSSRNGELPTFPPLHKTKLSLSLGNDTHRSLITLSG